MTQISSSSILAIFTISLLFLCSIQFTSGQKAQFITYWNTTGCTGTPIGNASANTNIPIPTGSPTVYYRVNGLWKAQHCNATICTDLPYIAQGFNTNCASRPTGINNTWIQVTRYADANQEVPIITFYERPSFEGTFFTAYPGAALNQTARSAGSFYYVGPTSWQHKSSQNAVSGTCLNASAEVVQRGYGFSYQLNANIQVGWVQSGCNVTQPPTTTTLRTTTTTQRSTTQSSGFTHGLEIGPFILALFCAIRL